MGKRIGFILIIVIALMASSLYATIPLPPRLPSFRTSIITPPATPDSGTNEASPAIQDLRQGVPVQAIYYSKDQTMDLQLLWPSQAASAIFQRGKRVIVVFDKPALFQFAHSATLDSPYYMQVRQIADQMNHSALSFTVADNTLVTVKQSGNSWILHFQPDEGKITSFSFLKPQTMGEPALHLEYQFSPIHNILEILDPQVGDKLFLVFNNNITPLYGKEYIDFTPLKSYCGMAFALKSRDLEIARTPNGFKISRGENQPLHISSLADQSSIREISFPENLLDFRELNSPPKDWFAENSRYLFTIYHSQGSNRVKARQKMILFLLATGHFAEASGNITLMEKESPDLESDPTFMALKAICHAVNYQPDRAEKIFNLSPFREEPEILLWKGVSLVIKEKYSEGLKNIIPNVRYLKDYPAPLRNFVALLAAKAADKAQYPGQIFLRFVSEDNLSPYERPLFDLYGLTLQKNKNTGIDQKRAILSSLMKSINPFVRVEAALKLVDLKKGNIKSAIHELESLRQRWRGDQTEMQILDRLAALYLQDGKPIEALTYLRQINDYFKNYPGHKESLIKAQDLFYQTFINESKKPSYKSIALYKTLRELVPPDERHKEILDQLVFSYKTLGLDQQAITILKNTLAKRKGKIELQDIDRILDLTALLIKNKKPEDALKALHKIPADFELDAQRQQKKRFLQTKILADQGQIDAALQILKLDESLASLQLQAALSWKAAYWPQCADLYSNIIRDKNLDPAERPQYILKMAVALAHSRNFRGLELLNQAFSGYMKKTPYGDAFLIITSPQPDLNGTAYQKSLKALESADEFDRLLKDYNKKK